jgi:Ca2+-binding RTX toxin-like protein
VDSLENRILLAAGDPDPALNFSQVGGMLDQYFTKAQTTLAPKIGRTLPLIGDKLDDTATFLGDIAAALRANVNSTTDTLAKVKTGLQNAFTQLNAGTVSDPVGENTDPSDDDFEKYTFDLTLSRSLLSVSSDELPFTFAIPGLGFKVQANIDVKLGYTVKLKFVLDKAATGQFYLDTSAANDLSLKLEITPHGLNNSVSANLGFLRIKVMDDPAFPSMLEGMIGADVTDPSGDGKLTPTEISGLNLAAKMNAGASAKINLKTVTDFGSGVMPTFWADFHMDWGIGDATLAPGTSPAGFGSTPNITIDHVQVSLGEFFDKYLNPIIRQIQNVLKPLSPILDVLGARMPVLSDVKSLRDTIQRGQSNPDDKVTLIETMHYFDNSIPLDFINAVIKFKEIASNVPDVDENAKIDLGGFTINGPDDSTSLGVDVRPLPDLLGINLLAEKLFNPLGDFKFQMEKQPIETRNWFQGIEEESSLAGFRFPIIQDPLKTLQLYLGKDVSLFTFQLPKFEFKFPFELPPIPILPPLFVKLKGDFNLKMKLLMGFDTYGIRQYNTSGNAADLLQGFYVSDTDKADGTGPDTPEVQMSFGIGAFADLDLVVVEIGVGGGIKATVNFDLHDRGTPDGKIREQELEDNFSENGIFGIFDTSGYLEAGLSAFVKVGFGPFSVETNFDIVSIRLLDFDFSRKDVPFDLEPAEVTGTGTAALNVGGSSIERVPEEHRFLFAGSKYGRDGDEVITIKADPDSPPGLNPDGSQNINISILGYDKTYYNVRKIVADAGAGNDIIIIRPDVFLPAEIYGGEGDDKILPGSGPVTLHGGPGNDDLAGNDNDSTIYGDDGDDLISGGAGNDLLDAGAGKDTVFGNDGNDQMLGGDGIDALMGGSGDDTLDGGNDDDDLRGEVGNDSMMGFGGKDTLRGNAGNDTMFGGIGNDLITGSGGNDEIYGEADDDSILAGDGDDSVRGQQGNDTIDGEAGTDTVWGDEGADNLSGGADNDLIHGGFGSDVVFAGDGNDTVFGEENFDEIHGGEGDDNLYGQLGTDSIFGDGGNDYIEGNEEGDTIYGWEGNDTILGGAGADSIGGQQGKDSILGEADNDTIYGDEEDDTISGGDGNDSIVGGAGVDCIHGDAANDVIFGEGGADLIYGDDGTDAISGGSENDSIYAGSGSDTAHGDDGDDWIWGGTEGDALFGDSGSDLIRGEAGNDTVSGGDGGDVIEGGIGDDLIAGDAGGDRVFAGAGNDTVYGQNAAALLEDDAGDTVYGEAGSDSLFGNGGADLLDGGAGVDTIDGGSGNDVVAAGTGVGDSLLGGDGADQITGSDEGADADPNFLDAVYFGDVIDGGAGNDSIDALGGADSIQGGDGDDTVNSGQGRDLVRGGVGNDVLYAGRGSGDSMFGDAGRDRITGSAEGADTVSGGDDEDSIFGQAGNDSIAGDAGDDAIDGGTGTDTLGGGDGDDEILGGGGAGDSIAGDTGDDTLRGSDDGADNLSGGAGRDRILANGGSDTAGGGDGADTIDGGAGDDVLSGDAGSDLLIGGANHDLLYGHSASGAGDDNAVDYLYGDFGTGNNEAGGGRDQLFGQGGNDLLYGEGDDDLINAGGGASNIVNYGSGEGPNPADFVPPGATAPPTVISGTSVTQAGPTLPSGVDDPGRWGQFSSSATGGGLSMSRGLGLEPSVAIDAGGNQYVAWVDSRNGNYEVYVAKHSAAGGWSELAGSGSEGGISKTATSSRRPSIAIGADGLPVVAWTEFPPGGGSEIRVFKFDGSNWVSLGGAAAISSTAADNAVLVNTTAGPAVTYLDSSSGGVANVYVKRFSGGAWSGLGGAAFASGAGVSGSASAVRDVGAATDGTRVAVGWSTAAAEDVRFAEFSGATWSAVETVAATPGLSSAPTVAYLNSTPYVAWEDDSSTFWEVQGASRQAGGGWVSLGNVSNTHGRAKSPRLASGGGQLHLLWSDDTLATRSPGGGVAVYARKWIGSQFAAEVLNDSTTIGVGGPSDLADALSVSVDSTGRPIVAWSDSGRARAQAYVRENGLRITGTIRTASGAGGVQAILDASDLNPGDAIVVSGAVSGFTVGAQDAGVVIVGLPGSSVTGAITVQADDVTLQRVNSTAGVTVSGAARFSLRESTIGGGVSITGGTSGQIASNVIAGAVTIGGGAANASVEHNTIGGGVMLGGGGATNVTLRDNAIGGAIGVNIQAASSGAITANDIGATGTGMNIAAAFTGPIEGNDVHNASVGLNYAARAAVNGNTFRNNTTGVTTSVNGTVDALGFVNPSGKPNEIRNNLTGISMSNARVQAQRVLNNTTGVSGSGVLGGETLDYANQIDGNASGAANFNGPIQFNRFGRNGIGIAAGSGQLIHHNIIYRGTSAGVRINGGTDVRVVNNTFYTNAGDNVRVEGGSTNVQLWNNVMWADGQGTFDVNVADDSRTGFFADFNDYYSSAGGRILHWLKDFNDILDVQMDLNLFDLYSVGTTAVNPDWARPRFANKGADDYRIFDLYAGQRFSSPTIDAASPYIDLAQPATYVNLLSNPSFESGLTNWITTPGATTQGANPAPYHGAGYFFSGNVASGAAEQIVNLTAAGYTATQLDADDLSLVFGGRIRTVDDTGRIVLTFLNGASQAISTVTVPITNQTARWELAGDRRPIPAGTRSVRFRFEATRLAGNGNETYLDSAFVSVISENAAPDQGAYGNVVATDVDAGRAHVAVRSPDLYVDWELNRPHVIRWDSYGNAADTPVRIELWQDTADGPALYRTIATSTPDDGELIWSPQNTTPAIPLGTLGLRVQISYTSDNITLDRSSETFAIPEGGGDYYVDDGANVNDQFTPTATGSNRNTGKTPNTPKPLLTTVLRSYDLGPADTIHVDTGNYQQFRNVLLSGNTAINDDEGVTVSGPSSPTSVARIDPLGFNTGAMFDLNDADFVTIQNLTIGGLSNAVWLHNFSINFTGSYLTTSGNTSTGVRIEADSTGASLDHLSISGGGEHGIWAGGQIDSVTDSKVYNNAKTGIALDNAGPVVVEGNEVYGNKDGIGIGNLATSIARIGNTDLTLGRGNKVHHNAESGISASGLVVIAGNVANNNGVVGIAHTGAGSVVANVVFDNYDGIRSGTAVNNRVYHNTNAGITTYNGSGPTIGNVIYSNQYGVIANLAPNAASLDGPYLFNNLIYANSVRGVQVNGGRHAQIYNNTIYQPQGDAIRIDPFSGNSDIQIRNNILAVGQDYGLNVNVSSQSAVASDHNDLVTFGTGKVGFWSGGALNTLTLWRQSSIQDANSLAVDPLFVDIDGADNVLGWSATGDGRDDDFHLKSTAGSFHGGSLAPAVDATTGLPVSLTATLTNDAATSPIIDRGDPAIPLVNEPAPNGGFVNLGAFGNTAQASKSLVPYVTVTVPVGDEIRPAGQTLNIKWRSQDYTGTVDVQLWRAGGAAPVLVIADDTTNDGDYLWTIPEGLTPAGDYFIRVVRPAPGAASGDSPAFAIAPKSNFYYVNDDTALPGELTTAPGANTANGLSPSTPKASIRAILDQYDLGPGDVIIVDYGYYALDNNIVISADDAGVTIRGPGAPSAAAGSQNNALVLADAPTQYYRFGETSGTAAADSSGNSRNATYVNGPTLGQSGALANDANGAVQFDGIDDYVDLPDGFANFPSGFSFETWAFPTTSANWSRFFDFGNGQQNNNLGLARAGTSNDINFFTLNGASQVGSVTASNVLRNNQWQHIAVTMSAAGAVTIYVNGNAVASGNVGLPGNVVRTSNYIGKSNWASDPNYAGKLDETAFYDKVLTRQQIRSRYISNVGKAVIDRRNRASGAYAFDLQNADDVTIGNLSVTGAERGISASNTSDSDNVTITKVEAYDNASYGIILENTNDSATITDNDAHDNTGFAYGIALYGSGVISGNRAYRNQRNGIDASSNTNNKVITISGNDVYANGDRGIATSYSGQSGDGSPAGIFVTGNTVHENGNFDIYMFATYRTSVASGNTVYGAPTGIQLDGAAEAKANVVYQHTTGISTSSGFVTENRVFGNTGVGVIGHYVATVTGNRVYSNAGGGIAGEYTPNAAGAGPYFRNNLVYANGNFGIQLTGGRVGFIENNTVYQPTGDGIRLFAAGYNPGSYQIRIANNIVVVQNGYGLYYQSLSLAGGVVSDYNDIYATGSGKFARLDNRDFLSRADWLLENALDANSRSADPQFVDPDGVDNLLGATRVGTVVTDNSLDDDFHVKLTSPTIDAGDPDSVFAAEPLPSGNRANQGSYGNTREAAVSPAQTVQVLVPRGLERLDAGSQFTINWRSSGLTQTSYLARFNIGGDKLGDFNANPFPVTGANNGVTFATFDTSAVPNPPPNSAYQTYQYAGNGVGNGMAFSLPVANGTYSLRLHFWDNAGVGQRLVDVKINGVVVQANVDVRALAGAAYKVIVLSFPLTASGNNGILLELVNKSATNPAFLPVMELTAVNPGGVSSPTANLDYSTDGGQTWTNIATNQPMDYLGRGSFNWTVPSTPTENALIRIRANNGSQPVDVSDEPFAINAITHDFYVNDGSTAGDVFSTAPGDNANSGRSPGKPMASVSALLAAYDLGPGDVIHVDTGTYTLIGSINLEENDSGVTIQGPAGAIALFNRNNGSQPVFAFNGIDNATLDHLSLTGGNWGVVHYYSAPQSDNIVLSNLDVYGNSAWGILLAGPGSGRTLLNSKIHDNDQGVDYEYGANVLISGNTVYNNRARSISGSASGGTISGSVVFANGSGIEAFSRDPANPAAAVYVTNNTIFGQAGNNFGLSIGTNVVAEGNTVYGQNDNFGRGINLAGGIARNNLVYGNYYGITGSGLIAGNRVFNNSNAGIAAGEGSLITGNTVFNNAAGIDVTNGYNGSSVRSNLVYNNPSYGIFVRRGTGSDITGNTVYQLTGDGITIDGLVNAAIRSNIVQVNAGAALNVAANSGTGLVSDYNNLFANGASARAGRFGATNFATREQWFLEFGYDAHSISADPRFADPDGADNQLGYNTLGLTASYWNNETFTGAPALVRRESQVYNYPSGVGSPAPGVNADHFSVRWQGYIYIPADGQWTFYGIADDSERLYIDGALVLDQPSYVNLTEVSAIVNLTAGWHAFRYDWVETVGGASAVLRYAGPTVPKQIISGSTFSIVAGSPTTGTDDDFHLLPNSPSIDAGDPQAPWTNEPGPNGDRINQGHEGNTAAATVSPAAQIVQVLSPVGNQKVEVGKPATITWRSAGLTQSRPVMFINVGGGLADLYQPNQFNQAGYSTFFTNNPIDVGGVTNPAPQAVYQTYAYGSLLAYRLPLADGQYTLRLHFMEPDYTGPAKFNIKINGATVLSNYVLATDAGGRYEAVAKSFDVTASGGQGALVEIVANGGTAILSGIEVVAPNPAGFANPTANVEVSYNNGSTWSTIATNVAMDAYGRGSFNWTPTTATAGNTAKIRVKANQGTQPLGVSVAPFIISPGGDHYYVNDASLTGDSLATAVGDNFNSGKSPDAPMASLYALLQQYDLDAGDVIHVENGTYAPVRNLVMLPDDSGVRIQGPAAGAGKATIDRVSKADGDFVFEFLGADDVTLDRLALVNGYMAVRLYYNADSDRITLTNSEIYNSAYRGVFVGPTNDDPVFTNNVIHDVSGAFTSWGIDVTGGPRAVITGNTLYNLNGGGISVAGSATQSDISGNTVYGSTTGIYADSALVADNTLYNDTTGIFVERSSGQAVRNAVFSNQTGIITSGYQGGVALVEANVVYNNSVAGIRVGGATAVRRNRIYANAVGIIGEAQFTGGPFFGEILNNLIYVNTNQGLLLSGATAGRVLNNTIYQTVGDAIRIQGSANLILRNNILWTEAGADLYIAPDSQNGFTSDYNILYHGAGGAAVTGFWGGANRSTLAAWQAASGQDAHSIAANPAFTDIDGADNVLGYATVGSGYNGGADDNFYLAPNSPAIDHGHSWLAPATDLTGAPAPSNDPGTPNAGSDEYSATSLASTFAATGTGQNFKTVVGNGPRNIALPFSFPFYGVNYTSVNVGVNGTVRLGSLAISSGDPANDATNSTAKLIGSPNAIIAPLWDNLRTTGTGNDVFVDTSVVNQMRIRWNATHVETGNAVNFAVVLFADGRIRFEYGAGNTGLSPTIGISSGNGYAYRLASIDGSATLTNANTIEWSLAPGFRDIGAYEFRGSSTDTAAPTIPSSTPSQVFIGGGGDAPTVNHIDLNFSEPLNPIDATAASNYELRWAGPNNIPGDGDDQVVPLTPQYTLDSNKVTLTFPGYLAPGVYRITVFGSGGVALRDLSGNALDGDVNGTPGGDFVRTFRVIAPPAVVAPPIYTYATAPGKLSVKFNKDVSATLGRDDLTLTNAGGGVPSNSMTYAWDPATFTATWTFAGVLPDGNYLATINSAAVGDALGNTLDGNNDGAPGDAMSFKFFQLAADLNHDGSVDYLDFNILRANFGQSGKTQPQGDINYDGKVDFVDFQKMEQAFNQRATDLAPAAPPPSPPAPAPSPVVAPEVLAPVTTPKPTWSTRPVAPKPIPQPQPKPVQPPRRVAEHTDISHLVSTAGVVVAKQPLKPAKRRTFSQDLI